MGRKEADMTAQIPERLDHDGEWHSMCEEPLEHWLERAGARPRFAPMHTACWRGYIGDWAVVEDCLFLVGLEGHLEDGSVATVEALFPGSGGRVFAEWFSGEVRIPQGELLEYVHMGYESRYERYLFLRFERGRLVERSVHRDHGPVM